MTSHTNHYAGAFTRIERLSPMKKLLHVGSGAAKKNDVLYPIFPGEEWEHVRVDIDKSVEPDVIDDIRVLVNFDDGSADGVYSSHNIEHLHYAEAAAALKTFHRVLKPGGVCVIAVPDFEVACQWIGRGDGFKPIYVSPAGPITPFDMVFGYRPYTLNNAFQQHRAGFTVDSLSYLLAMAGFTAMHVTRGQAFDIWAYATKL